MSDAVVLVEGESDRRVLALVAERLGVDLAAADVRVVVLDGITNLRRAVAAEPAGIHVFGLYDGAEQRQVSRMLAEAGRPTADDAAGLEALGYYACTLDLEDELIRAAGPEAVVAAIAAAGELGKLRSFQRQPAQRGRPIEAQLHRFAGTAAGRKHRFGASIVAGLPLADIPSPIRRLFHALQADREPAR
ncbi:ATP-dependent endonuclease [Agromyces sp. MMS17-SY077]|uniref:ATP-dependent endonuclease n=1 Tax=Agromyces seonyuensis TaxID=2662446 RepID=A0A6I4P1J6_9MICO|nr:ATP-dependent endonuclease [Agromyces seonyuensis]